MENILQVLINAVKSRLMGFYTMFKLWTTPSYIKTRVTTVIRQFFTQTLSVKPRHKKDYYTISKWLVSKRLVYFIVLAVGVLCAYYLLVINPIVSFNHVAGVREYYYNALPLRFVDGPVKIKAKSGYVAYEGNVSKGAVTGRGTLYSISGDTVYIGDFQSNKFEGTGKAYYPANVLKYEGEFSNNLYEGEGTLYRENGSMEYYGAFSKGKKDGKGVLYNTGSNQVYQGMFSQDELVYSDLLGKSTAEIGGVYTGETEFYLGDNNQFVASLKDIDAVYQGDSTDTNIEDEIIVDIIYVSHNYITLGGERVSSVADLIEYFGTPNYQGYTKLKLAEQIVIKGMIANGDTTFDPVSMSVTQSNTNDVFSVSGYSRNETVYLYTFLKDGVEYQFFCPEKRGDFGFYGVATY